MTQKPLQGDPSFSSGTCAFNINPLPTRVPACLPLMAGCIASTSVYSTLYVSVCHLWLIVTVRLESGVIFDTLPSE